MSVQKLIDKASDLVGSPHALAKMLGVASSQVYDWRDGRKPCSAPDRARIAAFANEDPVQELVRATLEKTEGTLRGEQLRKALGKWLRQTGGVLHTVALGLVSASFGLTMLDVPRCILC